MWLAKPKIFTLWPFGRRRSLALVVDAGDTTTNKTNKYSTFREPTLYFSIYLIQNRNLSLLPPQNLPVMCTH